MQDEYRKLALRLDEIPNGFPATKSGVELKLLAKLFTPQEADLAASMGLERETVPVIAARYGIPEPEAKSLLIGMVKKGLIEMRREPGEGFTFCLIPFVVGFYERQNAKIDREFAELFEAYYREAFHRVMTTPPSVHRIIPVEKTIPVGIDVMPHEKASTYLDGAQAWGVLNCICRVQQSLIGKSCGHSLENCLVLSTRPGAFDRNEDIRAISREEAQKILEEADREGLVHSTSNTRDEVTYICNCCTCSCGILRAMIEYGSEHTIARSDFYAVLDQDLCSGCEACLNRCQFGALSMDDGVCRIERAKCFGCGLCVTSCPEEAISMVMKEHAELDRIPVNEKEWRAMRSESRSFDLNP